MEKECESPDLAAELVEYKAEAIAEAAFFYRAKIEAELAVLVAAVGAEEKAAAASMQVGMRTSPSEITILPLPILSLRPPTSRLLAHNLFFSSCPLPLFILSK